jgi:hypothetical protein
MIYFIGDNALFNHLCFFSGMEIRKIDIDIKRPVDFSDLNEISRIILQLELKDRDAAYIIPFLKFFVSPTINIALAGFLLRECFHNEIHLPIDQLFYIRLPASNTIMESFLINEKYYFDSVAWNNCRNSFNNRMSHIIRSFSKNDQLRYNDKIAKMMINF